MARNSRLDITFGAYRRECRARHMMLATATECLDEIKIIEEVNYCIGIEISGRVGSREGCDELEIVEEIDDSILIELCGARWQHCDSGGQ